MFVSVPESIMLTTNACTSLPNICMHACMRTAQVWAHTVELQLCLGLIRHPSTTIKNQTERRIMAAGLEWAMVQAQPGQLSTVPAVAHANRLSYASPGKPKRVTACMTSVARNIWVKERDSWGRRKHSMCCLLACVK
jgi:hypothetical protein